VCDTNRTLFLPIVETAALIAICTVVGVFALKIRVTAPGIGMLALGAAFLVDELLRLIRNAPRARVAEPHPDALPWQRPAPTSRSITVPPNGR
jgi:hypothetical protein